MLTEILEGQKLLIFNYSLFIEMKVSVIVPVYKAEKWLHYCVDSMLTQTITDFELLLIDDGSPDSCGEICDEYAKKDSRVRVFHQQNGGVNSARRLGFENSIGQYLMFVDPDDVLPKDALQTLLAFMVDDVNIVCGTMVSFEGEILLNMGQTDTINVVKKNFEEYRRSMFQANVLLSLCAKLYRRTILTNNVFDISREICKGQDVINGVRIAFNNNKDVLFIDKAVYYYRQHAESCVHSFMTYPEYEQKWYDTLWQSVPEMYKKEYINYLIAYKIKTLDSMFGYSVEKPTWIGSDFYNNLLSEIERYDYKGQIISRLLLIETNKSVRRLLIFVRKVLNILFRIKNKILRIWQNL